MFKRFWFFSLNFVRSGGGNGNRWGSISEGSGIWIGWGAAAGVRAGAIGVGERRGLRTVSVEVINSSEEDLKFSEILDVFTVDPVSLYLELLSKTGGADGKLFFVVESVDEPRITSLSDKKLLVTWFFGWIKNTASSEAFGSEIFFFE